MIPSDILVVVEMRTISINQMNVLRNVKLVRELISLFSRQFQNPYIEVNVFYFIPKLLLSYMFFYKKPSAQSLVLKFLIFLPYFSSKIFLILLFILRMKAYAERECSKLFFL